MKVFKITVLSLLASVVALSGCSDGPTGPANQSITGSGSDIGQSISRTKALFLPNSTYVSG